MIPAPIRALRRAVLELLFTHRILVLTFLAGMALLAAGGARRVRFDFTPQEIFRSGDPDFRLLEGYYETFGRDDNALVLLVRSDRLFTPEGATVLTRLHEHVAAVDGVQSVHDLTNVLLVRPGSFPPLPAPALPDDPSADFEAIKTWATSHPMLRGRLVAADGRSALVLIRLDPERDRYDDLKPTVEGLMASIEAVEQPDGYIVDPTGIPLARIAVADGLQNDWLVFGPVCAAFVFLVLLALFRDLRAVLVALFAVCLADLYTIGSLGGLDIPVNVINNVLPTLIFVIGVSDGIHLIVRYRDELQAGVEQGKALRTTLRHLIVACFLTSFTTAVGFASLYLARIEILKEFGLTAAGGVMLAYLVTVTFVPVSLSFLSPILPAGASRNVVLAGRVARWCADLVIRHRHAVLVGCALFTLVAVWYGSRVKVENGLYEAFDSDHPVVRNNARLEEDYGGVVPVAVVIEWREGVDPLTPDRLAFVVGLQEFVEADPLLGSSVSIADLVKEWNASIHGGDSAYRTIPDTPGKCRGAVEGMEGLLAARGQGEVLGSVWRPEDRQMALVFRTGDHGAARLESSFSAVDDWLAEQADRQAELGLTCQLTGDGPVASRGINRLIFDLLESLLLAFAIILVTMIILLRSVRAGLVSMIPNIFPLVVTLGFLGFVGWDLRVAIVIVFTISLGLAVDDTIHFMVRYREEYEKGADEEEALRRTFAGTGTAIFTTTILLAGGYGSLLLSGFPITRTFALCMEITVWAALVGDLLLLPACLLVFRPFRRSKALEADLAASRTIS